MLRMLVENATGNKFSVQDIRKLQRKLREIQPSLRTEFLREVKAIGKQPQKSIRDAIPTTSPLSGFTKPGATLKWGLVSKGPKSGGAKSTSIRFRTQAGGKSLTSTLLGIRVNSATTSVADMAGRSRRFVGKGYKSTGYSKPIRRTYADGSQSVEFRRAATRKAGEAFIRNLNATLGNRPSRMAWRAVEKDLPKIAKDVQFVVNKWAIRASRGF
jgi:hypothetical protein